MVGPSHKFITLVPQLAERFPTMRDPLARYVDNVNQLRDGIDMVLDRGVEWLRQFM